jgi:tetratricopeptide (TPR) repeat protein
MAYSPSLSDSSTLVGSPRTSTADDSPKSKKYEPFSSEDEHEAIRLREQRERAIDYQTHCQFEKAGECYEAIFQSCLQLFGDQNPRTLTAKEDLAVNLAHRGYYKRAQALFESVFKECRAQCGPQEMEQLAIARAYHNLANVLSAQNENSDAESHYLEAFKIRSKHLGSSNYDTLCTLAGLIKAYTSQEMFHRAEEFLLKIKEGKFQLTLEDSKVREVSRLDKSIDALMLGVTQSEAIIYDLRGKTDQAKEIFLSVWRDIQEIRPRDHPDILDVAANIGTFYDRHGNLEDAKNFFEIAMSRASVLGPTHPLTIAVEQNLSSVRKKKTEMYAFESL